MRSNTALALVLAAALAGSLVACDEDDTAPAAPPKAGEVVEPQSAKEPASFTLPGERFFPEGIALAPDGRVFIGSLATGSIAVRKPGEDTATELISPATSGMKGAVGLTVDAKRNLLWVCAADLSFQSPAAIRSFDLTTAEAKTNVTFPGRAICNDLTLDGSGNIYMTDSLGGAIYRLASGANAVEKWSNDAAFAFAGPPTGEHAVNGIVWDGKTSLYATRTDTGSLFRVPIGADGKAGAAVKVALDRDLVGPDGIIMLDDKTVVIAEHSGGMIGRVELDGDKGRVTTIAKDLTEPTTLVAQGNDGWVVEAQLGQLFNPSAPPPPLPFRVRRIGLR